MHGPASLSAIAIVLTLALVGFCTVYVVRWLWELRK